jgi:hypothetical protein
MNHELKKAIAAIDRAIELDPDNVRSRMIRDYCAQLQGIPGSKGYEPQDDKETNQ